MKIVVRRGLSVPFKGKPPAELVAAPVVTQIALTGSDHRGLRAELVVREGDIVAQGAALYRDRARPELVFTAPIAGRVAEIAIGPKRRMTSVTLAPEGEERRIVDIVGAGTADGMRALLLDAGLWPQFRTRPFDRIPAPDAVADAIFVTAIDTHPHAVDPLAVLPDCREDFSRGVHALALLTDGPVYVCQPQAEPLVAIEDRIKTVQVSGPHPAGLPGTHISRLFPVSGGRKVWHIEAQDVAAIGHLLASGEIDLHRTIAVSGEGLRNPRLMHLPIGADLHAVVRSDLTPAQKRILSGPALGGRESRYLSRYHRQVSVLDVPERPKRNWLLDALHKTATVPAFIPTQALENAFGPDIAAVPLLRALSVGDAEMARKLGCLQLAEDDMALATYATGGAVDFGLRLRAVLEVLEGGA